VSAFKINLSETKDQIVVGTKDPNPFLQRETNLKLKSHDICEPLNGEIGTFLIILETGKQ